jgi:tRNA G18 (ribose-2'-O)-methylase SpoU
MAEAGIDDIADPRLAHYRDLKQTNLTRWSGRFIAEGWLVVERLLASDFEVDSVLISRRRRGAILPHIPPEVPTYVVPQELAESLLGYNFHAGVLACARRKPQLTLEHLVKLAEDRQLAERTAASPRSRAPDVGRIGSPFYRTLVVCDRIIGPENLGTIVRLSAAFDVAGVLIGPGSADPFARRVLRVSMGNAFALPMAESDDLVRDLTALRDRWNVELVATVATGDAEPLAAAKRSPRMALILGNEAAGIDPALVTICQRRVTIPVAPTADSLNVGCAAAIFLHHFTSAAS